MLRRYLALKSPARGDEDDPIIDDLIQLNCIYKNKLFEHFYRWVRRSEPSVKLHLLPLRRRQSGRRIKEPPYGYGDCASCMMVETGEKASQAGARSLGG